MREAQTLRELLLIRRRHARWLRRQPGYLGSAVGYKYREKNRAFARTREGKLIPAVMVFVRRKLPQGKLGDVPPIPETFDGPGGTWCATDVIRGALPRRPPPVPPPNAANRKLLRELTEAESGLIGGLPITAGGYTGTAACVVQAGARRGFLTNWHIAGFDGTEILRLSPRLLLVGRTARTVAAAPRTRRDQTDLESYTSATHRLDAGFVAFPKEPAAPVKSGVHGLGPLGRPHRLNLESMDLLGCEVVGVGQTLGKQTGVIAAYGYEWRSDPGEKSWCATDYLILGKDGSPFAAPGDSGKLVVTADAERRPVALLWGGERQEFWSAEAQQTWSYASAIGLVLRTLRVRIVPGSIT